METMVDTIPAPVYYKNKKGEYLGCNKLFASRIIGLSEEEIIGRKLPELKIEIPPEAAAEYQGLDMELLRKGGKHVYETEVFCSDGRARDFQVNRATFRDETGEVTILAGVLLDISKLKRVEKALRDNLSFLETLLDAIPTPVFYKDLKGVYRGCNELFARDVIGLPKEKILGHTMQDFGEIIPAELACVYEEYDRKLYGEGKTQQYEAKVKCAKCKGTRDFLCTKALYTDAAGSPRGLVVVMQDITERKIGEEALQKSEERYRLAAEQTGQLVYDYDIKTNRNDWAGAIEKLTGYGAGEFQNINIRGWAENIHPKDRKRALESHHAAFKENKMYHEEYRFKRKDGSYFYAEDSGIFLRDRDGRIYRMLGVIKDITERKLAHEQLEQSEERYRTFIKNFKGIAFQSDLDFVPIFMHGALEEITGYREEEFVSGEVKWKQIIDPEDLAPLQAKIAKLSSTPHFFVEEEYRIRHRDGSRRWVREIVQHIPGNEGKRGYLQGTIYNINERKAAEEALAKAGEIRKKEIHHRIKNNLQVVSSLLELQADKFKDEEVVEAFRESQNRVTSMAIIHEELYESKDTLNLNFSTYLQKLTADLLHSYTIGNEKVLLELDVDEIFLGMDTAIPLGIIINELVSNSLKHAFQKGRKGEIIIKIRNTENQAERELENENPLKGEKGNRGKRDREEGKRGEGKRGEGKRGEGKRGEGKRGEGKRGENSSFSLVVSDNGAGFPEEVDFKKTNSLGLQLVNTLVEQIGGTIELKRDKGTKFIIHFRDTVH
nr:PAS domain S-box protein [Methanosarcina sp. KYL-1]